MTASTELDANAVGLGTSQRYARRRALGLCPKCGSERDIKDQVWCRNCLEYNRAHSKYSGIPRKKRVTEEERRDRHQTYHRNYRESLRRSVIEAYGGRCVCCGCDHLVFLQLDHINDDGGSHRKSMGIRGSFAFYRMIKKQGYPGGLQVLCANCHQAKTMKLPCPCSTAA